MPLHSSLGDKSEDSISKKQKTINKGLPAIWHFLSYVVIGSVIVDDKGERVLPLIPKSVRLVAYRFYTSSLKKFFAPEIYYLKTQSFKILSMPINLYRAMVSTLASHWHQLESLKHIDVWISP